LPQGVFRELMFQSLAERTGLELESLMRLEVPPQQPPDAGPEPPWAYDEPPPPDTADLPRLAAEYDGPRQRQPLAAPAPVHTTLMQSAIALLLHKPAVSRLADPGCVDHLEGSEGRLLRDILELLHKRPESSTGMLLGHWHGTDEGELLAHLAGQERLIPTEGIEAQFGDILRRLTAMPLRRRISDEIATLKSRPYEQLKDDDKARLRELIRSLRALDERTGPRSTDATGPAP